MNAYETSALVAIIIACIFTIIVVCVGGKK